MLNQTSIMSVVVFLIGFAGTCSATPNVFDDFEDGNYTDGPTWFVTNAVGLDEVVSDALFSGNLALRMRGTGSAHRRIDTVASVPWDGFSFSVNFRADGEHQADFQLKSDQPNDTLPSLTIRWTRDSGASSSIVLREGAEDLITLSLPYETSSSWITVATNHDPASDLVTIQLKDALTGALLQSASTAFSSDLASSGPIRFIGLGAQKTDWQYFDNVMLQDGYPCLADLNKDGILDLQDVSLFIGAFVLQDTAADIAEPFGVFDLSDIGAFIDAFNSGCP